MAVPFLSNLVLAVSLAVCLSVSVEASALAADAAVERETGFDPDSIAAFVHSENANQNAKRILTAETYARRNILYRVGNSFRVAGAIEPARLAVAFATGEDAVLAGLLDSKASRQAPGIWRYFFRQSLIYVGRADAPVSRIGFYNPIVDGWVMTDWRWTAQTIRLTGAQVVSGETVLGLSRSEEVRIGWTRPSQLSLIARMRGATGLAGEAFADAHPMAGGDTPLDTGMVETTARSRLTVEARLVAVLANLNIHYRDAARASLSGALIDAIKRGDKAALIPLAGEVSPQSLHIIAGLPSAMRNNLELVGHFPTPSGAVMVFGVPMMSRWLMIARYVEPVDGATGGVDGLAAFEVTPSATPDRGTNHAGS